MPVDYSNPWTYLGTEVDSEMLSSFFGFVYLITIRDTGQKYIGRKYIWSRRKEKGKSRRKRVESDWKTYYSSHEGLKQIGKENPERLQREILHLCCGEGETNFLEIEEQFKRDVLYSDEYLNDQINGKWFKKNVQGRYRNNDLHHTHKEDSIHAGEVG